jgi:hypothetical protein
MSKKNKFRRPMPAASSGPVTRSEFNPDYTHVKRDLTRIGTLAGIAFVVLIVLSFFLR